MTLTQATRVGTLALVELHTPSPADSADFYHRLLGWNLTDLGEHILAEAGDRRAAVLYPRHPTIGDISLPAEWGVAFRTDTIRGAVERVRALGGRVVRPPTESMDGWRTAVVRDPTGGAFSLMEADNETGVDLGDDPGAPGWCELESTDPGRAVAFYQALLGWDVSVDTATAYATLSLEGRPQAGVREGDRSVWVPFFNTGDLDRDLALVPALGAVTGPRRAFEGYRFARVEDPAGAVFGLLETVPRPEAHDRVTGEDAAARVSDRLAYLLREGNRRHLVVSDRAGQRILEMPVTVGLLGAAIAPVASAAGTVAALAARWRFTVVVPGQDN